MSTPSAGPSLACGQASYIQCSQSVGGGCCPSGLVCHSDACLPSVTGTTAFAAPSAECVGRTGYVSCDQSVGGDCCPFGYLCDPATDVQCRLTLKLSEVAQTVTTTIGTLTETLTQTVVDGPTRMAVNRVSEVTSSSGGSSGGGLTTAQIGGIVGGVVGGLLLLAAAVLVVLQLKGKRWKLVDRTAEGGSGIETRELHGPGVGRAELPLTSDKTPVEVDAGHRGHELEG